MKLIYCYIQQFRNIKNQEVLLSPVWDVHFVDGHLYIKPKADETPLEYVYGDRRRHDLHVIVGKTGSGKTNFLQLLGMNEELRYVSVKEGDAYLLLYAMDKEGCFAVEFVGLEIEGLKKKLAYQNNWFQGVSLCFEYDYDKQEFKNCSFIREEDTENTYIVNAFDRYSYADCPFDDIREESINYRGGWLPRMISQFGNSRISLECESLKFYLRQFADGNLKYRTALCIRSNNWQDKIPAFVPERILNREYWTYREKRIERDAKINGTPKSRFIHDLMVDFALYLRKWAGTLDRNFPDQYFSFSGAMYDLGIKNPRILPDGENIPLRKRIDWLCQYIDYHTDEITSNKGLVWQIGSDINDIFDILEKMDAKYFTDDTFVIPVTEIDASRGKPMFDLFERMEQYRPDDVGLFSHCLLPYSWTHISSGEYQFAKVWSILNEYAVMIKVMVQGMHYDDAVRPNLIVLMDEPESYMHPEMCRCFLKQLYELMDKRQQNTSLQVILTTHSPFMLSDVLANQVVKMDIDEQGFCRISQDSKPTFAANVHSIMADSFFLDYTIGEYAREFLTEKFSMLKEFVQRKEAISDNERNEVLNLKKFVANIGDDLIRHSFENLLKML